MIRSLLEAQKILADYAAKHCAGHLLYHLGPTGTLEVWEEPLYKAKELDEDVKMACDWLLTKLGAMKLEIASHPDGSVNTVKVTKKL